MDDRRRLVSAPSALADTAIVGSTTLPANNGHGQMLSPQNAPVFQGDAGADYVLSSPIGGTVSSWRFRSGGVDKGSSFALRVLRPADATGTKWTAVATSAPVTVTSATLTDGMEGPFTTSLPIQKGDRVGLQPVDGGDTPIEDGVIGQDGVRYFGAAFADGTSATLAAGSTADNGQVVPVQATVQSAPAAPPRSPRRPRILRTHRRPRASTTSASRASR